MSKEAFKSILRTFGFCGACIAFYIGAGFATMQEVMQYDASYGSRFWIVVLVSAVIYLYTNLSFAWNGNRYQIKRGGEIYRVYCGKWIGYFFDYFSAFFCYMCFIVMCGGANSTAMEQWGLPNGVGASILAVAVIATAVFGLNGILKVLDKLGPIIILLILVIAIGALVIGGSNLSAGFQTVDSGAYQIEQVGNNNPFFSGASYGGFVILWFATFLSEIGAKNKLKEVNVGMILSAIGIFAATILCSLALIANIDDAWNSGIPAIVLANKIHLVFGTIFAVIIFLGIFTTAVPLLWAGVKKVSKEGTWLYRIITIAGGAVGCVIACFVPYKGLINILYGINGYLGFILIAFMIVHDIYVFVKRVKGKKQDGAAIAIDAVSTSAEPAEAMTIERAIDAKTEEETKEDKNV